MNKLEVLAVTAGVTVMLLIVGIYSFFNEIEVVKETKVFFNTLKNTSESYAQNNKTVLKAEQMGVNLSASNYVFIIAMSILTGAVFAIVFKSAYLIIIGAMVGYMLPENIIEHAKTKKQKDILMSSIPSVEMIAIESMSTPNLTQAIIQAIPNMHEPFKSEIEQVIRETNSGKYNFHQALDRMVYRTKSKHLRKVASSIKFADSIGGDGTKILQKDANLLYKDKMIYEKAETRLKNTKKQSYLSSVLQLLPFVVFYISLPDIYEYVMNIWIGHLVLFLVLVKIILDFYITAKKTRSLLH